MSLFRAAAILVLVLVLAPDPALAGKFENKDTAGERRETSFGTRNKRSAVTMTTDPATGEETVDVVPPPKIERDTTWDKMIIKANIDSAWPRGNGTTSSTTETTSTSGDNSTSTTTTTSW
ncbi:MAG: hypothetical protein JW718_05480 [Desulfovibrionaceae bacterium]|nr:hypothetical protein [Desulfovibrionaceae bacterium]